MQKESEVLLYTDNTNVEISEQAADMVKVPNVMGYSRLGANDQLAEAGLKMLVDPPDQTGVAFRQFPAAGTEVELGTEVLVEFENASTASVPTD